MKTTKTIGGTYTHLEDRDLHADLAKAARRKWRHRPGGSTVPVLPTQNQWDNKDSILIRFIGHLNSRIARDTRPIIIHLFDTAKPQTIQLNRAICEWARAHPVRVRLVRSDPIDWGTEK